MWGARADGVGRPAVETSSNILGMDDKGGG
jgi:hypothetical protein